MPKLTQQQIDGGRIREATLNSSNGVISISVEIDGIFYYIYLNGDSNTKLIDRRQDIVDALLEIDVPNYTLPTLNNSTLQDFIDSPLTAPRT